MPYYYSFFLNFVIGVTSLLTFSCYHYCWNICGTTTSVDVTIAPANNVFAFITPREKCRNTEFLRKPPYSVRIQENTDQKKLRIWTLFTQ